MDEYFAKLDTGDWAAGASLNVVDLNAGSMANAEASHNEIYAFQRTCAGFRILTSALHLQVLLDSFDVFAVVPGGNYSHMNMFKHLEEGIAVDLGDPSTMHRQARINDLPAPASTDDIAAILGDDGDSEYPIYRDITLTSSTLDATTGVYTVWVGTNPADTAPTFVWHLKEWF